MFLFIPKTEINFSTHETILKDLDKLRPSLLWGSIDMFRKKAITLLTEAEDEEESCQKELTIKSLYDIPENINFYITTQYETLLDKKKQHYDIIVKRNSYFITVKNLTNGCLNVFEIQTTPTEKYIMHSEVSFKSHLDGILYLTTEHLIFVPKLLQITNNTISPTDSVENFTMIKLQLIQGYTLNGNSAVISLNPFYHPQLPSTIQFTFTSQPLLMSFINSLQEIRFGEGGECKIDKTMNRSENRINHNERVDGIYNPNVELARQQMETTYMISDVNATFTVSPTYPCLLIVPIDFTDAMIKNIAQFRSHGRIPIVTYFDKKTGAALFRASQPLVANSFAFGVFKTSQCKDDEKLIDHFRCDGRSKESVLVVLDCRPVINAVGNRFNGGGTESSECYKNCIIHHLNLPNVNVVFSAYQKMVNGIVNKNKISVSQFYTLISEWLDILQEINKSVVKTVDLLRCGNRVLVHCSDGWDRTPEMSSLSRICLDRYHRTLEGFLSLIEFEWIMLGHRFQTRLRNNSKKASPIFIQFLEIVTMLMKKYPNAFEFTTKVLVDLAVESVCPTTGSFLFDCEKDRRKFIPGKTRTSFLQFILENKEEYINKNQHISKYETLDCKFELMDYGIWNEFYCRQLDVIVPINK